MNHLAGPLAEGRLFETSGEAVAGAFVAVDVGASFTPAHGEGQAEEDEDEGEGGAHDGFAYTVTGRMAATGSPWDRAIPVPVEGVWQLHGLSNGHPFGDTRIGPPFVAGLMPGTPAVLVHATELWGNYALKSRFTRPDLIAFFPGTVLAQMSGFADPSLQ